LQQSWSRYDLIASPVVLSLDIQNNELISMATAFPLPKRIAKSTLSQYLRTKCDRQLFLSLHQPAILQEAGLPEPMPARPGVGVLQSEGKTFEEQRNDKLIAAFGAGVTYAKGANGQPKQVPLAALLASAAGSLSFLLQGKIEPGKFQSRILTNLGLPTAQHKLVPPMDGLIPDIIIVRDPRGDDEAITPKGGRRALTVEDEKRRALVVIDVKHTSEANPSYSAEVALYAVMIANWLEETGNDKHYFVAVNCALWTRFKEGESAFDAACAKKPTPPSGDLLAALMADCEDANLRFYLTTVLRFFREDLPRVATTGDAKPDGWRNLEWHVDSRCSSCDFLGYARWVPADFKAKLAAQPDHYCHPGAELSQHLSRIAGMTRGGRKTLHTAAINTTTAIASTTGTEPIYAKHTFLKREGAKLPARAKALANNALDVDTAALLATLAPWPQLTLAVAVNFDPSSGLLTGLALGGGATAYQTGQKPLFWKHQGFVVDQKTLSAEWNELKAFLSTISDYIDQADAYVQGFGKGPLKGQIAFWEARQYEELCNAVGRHLPKVLALADKKQRALAWMFPPEELLEKDAGAVPPCVVFLDEIVRRVVFAPVAHVITLFDTTEHYHAGTFNPVEKDAFYREFLTNGIPRERIYEVWSNEPQIVRGKQTKSRNQVITEFSLALAKQSASIASVAEKLRQDFKGSIKSSNPVIDLSNPTGAQGVAFDAKLWIWWDKLGLATSKAAAHQRLALDGQALEANYEALRLRNGKRVGTTDVWEFDVLPTSTETKIEQGDGYLAIGMEAGPGYPLTTALDHLPKPAPAYSGQFKDLSMPLYSTVRATLVLFDRVTRRASVRVQTFSQPLLPFLRQHNVLNLSADLFLTASKPGFDWSRTSTDILRQVGNPAIATPDPAAAQAMGATVPTKVGTSAVTPLSKLLWAAPALQAAVVMPTAQAVPLATASATKHLLNPSQQAAVAHALEHALSIIWGPPGTGKTKTLSAYVHALVSHAAAANKGIKVLLTGPTYKAVEELVGRVIKLLDADAACKSEVYVCYSAGRQHMAVATKGKHLRAAAVEIQDQQFNIDCLPSMGDPAKLTIVATSVMQAHKFGNLLHGAPLAPVFDVVIIDESSQVEGTRAIAPLAVLKDGGRAVIAGDHLQMPPIAALEPPVGAEYLVGSIQAYLLQRPFGSAVTTCDLTENYRSHEHIVAYARGIGYPPQLSAHYPQTAVHPLAPLPGPSAGFPPSLPYFAELSQLVAVKPAVMSLLHDDDLSSQGNEVEASLVASIVWSLRTTLSAELDGQTAGVVHAPPNAQRFWENCVGIVTPHRAQRALVVRELTKLFPGEAAFVDEAVDTVEKFQGGERHVIIVSFGVADADVIAGEEAFLMQLQRTNVAISRAQAKCIVVMSTTLAGHVPQDKKALLTAHAIKDYVDDFCDQETPLTITLPGGSTRKGKLRFKA
jgi:hypothetical protein